MITPPFFTLNNSLDDSGPHRPSRSMSSSSGFKLLIASVMDSPELRNILFDATKFFFQTQIQLLWNRFQLFPQEYMLFHQMWQGNDLHSS